MIEQTLTRRKQAHAACRSFEQRDTELVLEPADPPGQRRLAHVEPPRRTTDVFGLGDRDERLELHE